MAKPVKPIEELHDILLAEVRQHPKCADVRFALQKLAEHGDANWYVKSINYGRNDPFHVDPVARQAMVRLQAKFDAA